MEIPIRFEIIGNSLALVWTDGSEDFWDASFLRKNSPSAEQSGEMDIFGRIQGGSNDPEQDFEDVKLLKFVPVGRYAIRLVFSDGHSTGIFSWSYLKLLREKSEEC